MNSLKDVKVGDVIYTMNHITSSYYTYKVKRLLKKYLEATTDSNPYLIIKVDYEGRKLKREKWDREYYRPLTDDIKRKILKKEETNNLFKSIDLLRDALNCTEDINLISDLNNNIIKLINKINSDK